MRKVDSKFSPNKKIREDQYIAELICENSAKKSKIQLPTKFWKLPEWASFFIIQLKHARKLIDKHGFDKTVSFIRAKNIYSLNAKWIDESLSKYNPPKIQKVNLDDLVTDSTGKQNKQNDFGYLDD